MTPERWQLIEEIFHAALEIDPVDRDAFLRAKTGDDDELLSEAVKLLSQFDDASSFIEQPLYEKTGGVLSSLFDDRDDDPMVGKVLGSYRIEREIGRGGMGAVYEAVRADGEFRLRAAIKVVKRGIDTDFVLRRFRNERQILATLDHPFITRLIDGGTTDDGRPYFVMEYVDGSPIYRYCDKRRMTLRERLELFSRVCEAVEYAHQHRVIHRDIKPSNIFVAVDGSPRLLDFGIAKLLDPELASDTLQPTATSLRMMTVDYASPEQIRGEKVTYASDVYSLGVILFELVTGYRPYVITSRSPHEIAKVICDDAPVAPSTALRENKGRQPVNKLDKGDNTLERIADQRGTTSNELIAQINGSLDNIVLRSLQKDLAARYRTVAELRNDIERILSGESISYEFIYPKPERPTTGPPSDTKLVAVLPLSLLSPAGSGNTDESYLTIGLADSIITRLTSVRKLTVRPTSSVSRYNEGPVNPLRAGIELGVDFVLDGRVRRFGHRIRVSLQLLDIASATAIWAAQFDEDLTDVLELEDAISEQVASALIPHLTGEEKQKLAKRGTNNPAAYEAYLKGRFYWNQFTAQSLPKAIQAFEKAIEIDPKYALAHVGIADFYIWANIYGLVPVAESYEAAGKAARRALEIDKDLGEAYASLGLIVQNRSRLDEAERLYLKALELNPNYSLAHEWYSALLVMTGRTAKGVEEILAAERLDPLSLRAKTLVVWTLYQAGEFERSLEKAEEIIALDENYPQGHLQRGYVLSELGRADEGVESIRRSLAMMPGSDLAEYALGFALAAAGRRNEALASAARMEERSLVSYVKPMFLAMAFTAAGSFDNAFKYLEIAVDERDPWLAWLATDAKLTKLRLDARFRPLYERTLRPPEGEDDVDRITDPATISISDFEDPNTNIASEMPTLAYQTGFFSRHYGKIIAAAVIIVALGTAYKTGILTFSFSRPTTNVSGADTAAKRSVAVLPFENITGDPANDYLSDGISELLISRVGNVPEIRIISRSAVFTFKNRKLDPQSIGRELGVDNVLAGSVNKDGEKILVRLDLINVADGKHLFSMNFVETADRVVALQEELARRVVQALDIRSLARSTPPKSYTENNDAFQLYLQAEFNRQKGTPAGSQTAIELYKQALQVDPNYGLAYQGLSLAYRSAPAYGAMSPQEAYPKAKDAAQKALAIDPSLSVAYVSLASVKATYEWDFEGAEREYKQAISLGPNNSEAHYSYGNFLVAMNRTDEGLAEFRIAQQIDPLSLNIQTNVGWALYIAGRYDEAATQVRQVIAKDPTFARAYMNIGEITEEQGKFDEAIAYFKKAKELSNDPLADMALGHAYAAANRRPEATAIAVALEDKVRQKQVSPFLPAVVYAGLDEKDKAFYWLERAYQERSNWLTLIKVGRRLKNLRSDPRFDDLMTRVGFTAKRL